jgi:acylphosphatase
MPVTAPRNAADIIVEGRVQGVGYRDFVQRRARHLGAVGYVMNLPNGHVRVRAEGSREILEQLVRALEKGPPLSQVEKVSVRWLPPTGRFASFDVRFGHGTP